MSTITSRCGSVSLMGLGISLLGLAAAALMVASGQVWLAHQQLQDAMDNAILVMNETHQTTPATLVSLIEANDPGVSVRLLSWGFTAVGGIQATAAMPIQLWFWASWMGIAPIRVVASA